MKVSIEYPEAFPLRGVDWAFFDYILKKMFRKRWVDPCDLRRLQKKLGQEKDLPDELQSIGFDHFRELPPEIVGALPRLIGQHLGVTIIPLRMSNALVGKIGTGIKFLLPILLLLAVLVMIVVLDQSGAHRFRRKAFDAALPTNLSPRLESLPFEPQPVLKTSQTQKVLEVQMVTSTVSSALRRLGATIPPQGKLYQVQVVITTVPDESRQ